jgi:hypothetical protein
VEGRGCQLSVPYKRHNSSDAACSHPETAVKIRGLVCCSASSDPPFVPILALMADRIATVLSLCQRRQVPALIAGVEPAGTAVTLQRHTQVVRPDRHPEFP